MVTYMKLMLNGSGQFTLEPSEELRPTEDEVVLQVKACSICGSDLPRAFESKAYYYPCVAGHEFAGYVKEAKDPSLQGMRAVVFPILPCKNCEYCAKEEYANCIQYDYYGSRRDGGMQDTLLIKKENLILLPDCLSYEEGACVEPLAVTIHAVKKAGITPGCTVNIFGAGGIGIMCGLWARFYGADTVRFSDIDQAKLDFAVSLGFEVYNGENADVCIEASGAGPALVNAIRSAATFGTVVIVGNAHKTMEITVDAYSQILRKQLNFHGSWNSSYASHQNDWQDAIDALAAGKIDVKPLITHRFPLEEGGQAFITAHDPSVFKSRVMIVME